jgi:hypothetical protein
LRAFGPNPSDVHIERFPKQSTIEICVAH